MKTLQPAKPFSPLRRVCTMPSKKHKFQVIWSNTWLLIRERASQRLNARDHGNLLNHTVSQDFTAPTHSTFTNIPPPFLVLLLSAKLRIKPRLGDTDQFYLFVYGFVIAGFTIQSKTYLKGFLPNCCLISFLRRRKYRCRLPTPKQRTSKTHKPAFIYTSCKRNKRRLLMKQLSKLLKQDTPSGVNYFSDKYF